MAFALHPQLAADTIGIMDYPLCSILLQNNRHFPWLILVPRLEGLHELFDLTHADYHSVMQEIRHTAEQFARYTHADKINIAALGNMVPQLHIHIIARYKSDPAWPNPVWNAGIAAEPYAPELLQQKCQKLAELLQL